MADERGVLPDGHPPPLSAAAVKRVAIRDSKGRLMPGSHLNDGGADPYGMRKRAQIVQLKENLELAVRGPAGPLNASRVVEIVRKMAQMAMAGDVRAAKLILSLAVSPAGTAETKSDNAPPTIVIRIENATAPSSASPSVLPPPIEGDFTEITPNE